MSSIPTPSAPTAAPASALPPPRPVAAQDPTSSDPSASPDTPSDVPPVAPAASLAPSAQVVGGTTAGASSPPRGALSSEVIVVDDGESPPLRSPQTSPSERASARLQVKKVAGVLRAAARKPQRVGPATGTALVKARKKKLKAGTPASPALPEATTSERQPPARTQLDTSAALPSEATASPVPPCPTESPANATGGVGDEERPRAPAALPVVGVTAPVRPAPETAARSARAAFDLEEFCRAHNPAKRVTIPPSLVERLSLAEKVDKLFELFGELRRSLQPAPDSAGTMAMLPRSPVAVLPGPAVAARPSTPDADLLGLVDMPIPWTLPLLGAAGGSSAAAVCHLRCSSFDVPRAKVKDEYYPPQARHTDCSVTSAPMKSEMEQLQRGSSNANFAVDFGAGATLPATDVRCPTYEGLLAAVGGLISFGDALCSTATPTPERVMLTLMYVNQFLGRALAHLLVNSPHWWREFFDAVRAVDYHSPDWQAALNGLALRMATSTTPSQPTSRPSGQQPRQQAQPRRGPATRIPIMPEHLRSQIPRDRDDRECCLRFLAGGMCYGGSANRCAHHQRTHRWEGCLPPKLHEFVVRHYNPDRHHQDDRHRG
ncbi:hypothetical protein PF010_g9656 [Phytophthora fragariae]|uniref:Uncharacterized protein n=1 Tax=Phytophthora fragariae TaxID=53985 RepID=A0A6G0LAW4_9STRA|nr:hypothetical protein PF010_g9656 [Phytophthora fragariae]